MAKPSPKSLSSSHALLKAAIILLKRNYKYLTGVILVGIAVYGVLSWGVNSDARATVLSLWSGFYSCALIWAIRHAGAKTPKVSAAYYQGTAPVLKFYLVFLVIALSSLPLSLGLWLYTSLSYLAAGSSWLAEVIGLVIGLGLAALSLWLLTRLSLALIIVTLPQIRPVGALKLSWRLGRGYGLKLSLRLGVFFGYTLILILLLSGLLGALKLEPVYLQLGLEASALLIIMPLLYAYLMQIYRQLT